MSWTPTLQYRRQKAHAKKTVAQFRKDNPNLNVALIEHKEVPIGQDLRFNYRFYQKKKRRK